MVPLKPASRGGIYGKIITGHENYKVWEGKESV